MDFIPPLHLAIGNGWLLLTAYFIGLIASVLAFPADKRKKLFLEPHYPRGHFRWFVILAGRIAAISFVVLSIFTGLHPGSPLFYLGMVFYAGGTLLVMGSLYEFKRAPTESLATGGVYRYSRNPQWVGLALVFLGTALAMGSMLHLILALLLIISYHFQILLEEEICTKHYGEAYLDYMKRVPRYLVL